MRSRPIGGGPDSSILVPPVDDPSVVLLVDDVDVCDGAASKPPGTHHGQSVVAADRARVPDQVLQPGGLSTRTGERSSQQVARHVRADSGDPVPVQADVVPKQVDLAVLTMTPADDQSVQQTSVTDRPGLMG